MSGGDSYGQAAACLFRCFSAQSCFHFFVRHQAVMRPSTWTVHFDDKDERLPKCFTFNMIARLAIRSTQRRRNRRGTPLANHPCRNVCGCQRGHGVARVSTPHWNEEHQRFFFVAPDATAVVVRAMCLSANLGIDGVAQHLFASSSAELLSTSLEYQHSDVTFWNFRLLTLIAQA